MNHCLRNLPLQAQMIGIRQHPYHLRTENIWGFFDNQTHAERVCLVLVLGFMKRTLYWKKKYIVYYKSL